ncbi:MAG: acyl transferase/acyl hydrolase/lysophospholipase [Monoraphidium minutum]|nr:MAG: acyl transferase/acyl hydrolase/lysophospholipase [Monoraphidium minutum]
MRRPRAARVSAEPPRGAGLGGALADGLRWLNWDAARAYGAGKGGEYTELIERGRASPGGDGDAITSGSSSGGGSLDGGEGAMSSGGGSSSSGGVTSVSLKDPAKLERIRSAFKNGTLGFGFSAGGLMFPYYVGVVSSLQEMGVLGRPHQLAGASAGSLIAAAFNAGLDMSVVEESMILFGEDCLANGTQHRRARAARHRWGGLLGPLLRDFLHSYLPPDAHERCSGSTHVAVTRALPFWRPQMVSHFKSRDDLIEALLTSCHIPWYFDGRWMTKFRGKYAVDGGATNFIPVVPGCEYTCKVMCFPTFHLEAIRSRAARLALAERYLDIDISLDAFEEWGHGYPTVIKWALQASTRETSSFLIEKGKRDARSWVVATGLDALLAEQQGAPAAAAAASVEGAAAAAAAAGAAARALRERGAARRGGGEGMVLPEGYARRRAAAGEGGGAEAGGAAAPCASPAEDGQQQEQQQQQGAPHPHGHKRRRDEDEDDGGGGSGGAAPFVPGLSGEPRTDTDPLHDKTPA